MLIDFSSFRVTWQIYNPTTWDKWDGFLRASLHYTIQASDLLIPPCSPTSIYRPILPI